MAPGEYERRRDERKLQIRAKLVELGIEPLPSQQPPSKAEGKKRARPVADPVAPSRASGRLDRERKRTGSVDDLLPLIASGVAIWRPLPKGSKLPTKPHAARHPDGPHQHKPRHVVRELGRRGRGARHAGAGDAGTARGSCFTRAEVLGELTQLARDTFFRIVSERGPGVADLSLTSFRPRGACEEYDARRPLGTARMTGTTGLQRHE